MPDVVQAPSDLVLAIDESRRHSRHQYVTTAERVRAVQQPRGINVLDVNMPPEIMRLDAVELHDKASLRIEIELLGTIRPVASQHDALIVAIPASPSHANVRSRRPRVHDQSRFETALTLRRGPRCTLA